MWDKHEKKGVELMGQKVAKEVEKVCKTFQIDQHGREKQIINNNIEIKAEVWRRVKDLLIVGAGFRAEVQGR